MNYQQLRNRLPIAPHHIKEWDDEWVHLQSDLWVRKDRPEIAFQFPAFPDNRILHNIVLDKVLTCLESARKRMNVQDNLHRAYELAKAMFCICDDFQDNPMFDYFEPDPKDETTVDRLTTFLDQTPNKEMKGSFAEYVSLDNRYCLTKWGIGILFLNHLDATEYEILRVIEETLNREEPAPMLETLLQRAYGNLP